MYNSVKFCVFITDFWFREQKDIFFGKNNPFG